MRPQDLDLLHGVSDPQLQPDGDLVAHVVSSMSIEHDEISTAIHVADLGDGSVRRYTGGPLDSRPRWSPDGRQLAFLRAPARDERPQVALLDLAGGEARLLTDFDLGASDLTWTPDGARLVVVSTQWRADVADLDEEAREAHPRRITELGFRQDGKGWVHDRTDRLWVVDPAGDAEPQALTPDDRSVASPVVTVDGSAVVFASARHADRETNPGEGLWRVPLDGGDISEVAPPGDWRQAAAARDGGLLLSGMPDIFSWPAPPTLHHVAADGTITQRAPDLDRDVAGSAVGPIELDDGSVLCIIEDRGAASLIRVAVDDGHEVVVGGAQVVTGYSASPDGSRIAYTATHTTDPGELWVLEDGEPRVLTSHNEELRELLLPVEHFTFERDGAEIDAWAVLPEGDAQGVPLLVNIHGGPTAQYGHGFFDEFQVEAGAGYAVVGCNPRGSSGRGTSWSTAVVGAWMDDGSVDTLDLEAVADATIARYPRIDAERVGIMGGSYGGYVTARMLARTGRYRSAIVERGLLAWPSFGGTSDIGAYFDRMFLERSLPMDLADQWAASPVRTAADITTPTLVLHSLEDHRCPPEQAYQLFSMLRRAGVESELLLFPGEGHELSRAGSPKHRLQRFEAVLEWHGRYLMAGA